MREDTLRADPWQQPRALPNSEETDLMEREGHSYPTSARELVATNGQHRIPSERQMDVLCERTKLV